MGRERIGSVRQRGYRWLASVPKVIGERPRLECSFASEEEARAWLDAQLRRLADGLAPEKPQRGESAATRATPRQAWNAGPSADGRTLRDYALQWHNEKYVQLHGADAERTIEILRDLELHILPVFDGPLESDVAVGRRKTVAWTRAMAGYEPDPAAGLDVRPARTYAKGTVDGLLWIYSEVLLYAHVLGADVRVVDGKPPKPAVTHGISGIRKRGSEKRRPRLVTLEVAGQIATGLNVIHQLVLWLMRIAGLRISEAYGLTVSNFIDDGDHGFLLIEAQGGRTFVIRDDDEKVHTTHRKRSAKTAAGYRLIALPGPLTQIIRCVIDAYHTDPATKEVDLNARLVPTIRSGNGGQAGFRTALASAAAQVDGASADPDDYVVSHDLRKAYATDLAWTPELDNLVKRRAMGHRAGSDVFDLVYTLDDRLKDEMIPAAARIGHEIAKAIGTLIVRTARRPFYGRDIDAHRIAYTDAVLETAGWQVRTTDGYITPKEAAVHLGMAESATRRLFGKMIPAVKDGKAWFARLDDVLAFRDRLAGRRLLPDVAADAGVSYHVAYRALHRLGIAPAFDEYSRVYLLNDEQAERVLGEFRRLAELKERAMTVTDAAGRLRTGIRTVNNWARDGRLAYDPERDASGTRYVTRASVEAELAARGNRRQSACIAIADLKRMAQLDDAAIRVLIDRHHLVRTRPGFLTARSVEAWIVGFRPDLLDCELLVPK